MCRVFFFPCWLENMEGHSEKGKVSMEDRSEKEVSVEYDSEKRKVSITIYNEKGVKNLKRSKDDQEISLSIILLHINIWVTKLLHYIWVKRRQCCILFTLAIALGIVVAGVGISMLLRGGGNETVPYDHSTILDETTTTYLTHSAEEAPEVTQPPTSDHPRPTYADSESSELHMEADRRQNQSLEGPECTPRFHDAQLASLLNPKDELLDKNFYPKRIMIGKCIEDHCKDKRLKCLPAWNSIGLITVLVFYEENGKPVYVKRTVPSDSSCECLSCFTRN